ncbi:MAG: P-loop NTPase fold protein [Opitutales bacterium]|nr:P-loop NTPase fold protein [Opitutales bacterium]
MDITSFEYDLLDLSPFAERLERFLEVEHRFVSGSLVVSLSSSFGSGKTTFLRMWQSHLLKRDSSDCPMVVYVNAWESDFCGDPLYSIVSALVEELPRLGCSHEKIVDAAKKVGRFGLAIANQIVRMGTGVDPIEAGKIAECEDNAFSAFQIRKEAMKELKTAIRGVVKDFSPRVIFLVDELDRCRPDYAISYLETIKHVFDIRGAVFVLAVDRKQLENSARVAFGRDLDFEEYFRKFVHRDVSLPEISKKGYRNLAQQYMRLYLQIEGTRHCCVRLDVDCSRNFVELISSLKMTPRQIQEVFRIAGHVFSVVEDRRPELLWCFAVGTILMATFKIGIPVFYRQLASGQLDRNEAKVLLEKLFSDTDASWWMILLVTGNGIRKEPVESASDLLKRVGLSGGEGASDRDFSQWFSGWGHERENCFRIIFEKIEYVSTWM